MTESTERHLRAALTDLLPEGCPECDHGYVGTCSAGFDLDEAIKAVTDE